MNNDFSAGENGEDGIEQYAAALDVTVTFLQEPLNEGSNYQEFPPGESAWSRGDFYLKANREDNRIEGLYFHIIGESPLGGGTFDLQMWQSGEQMDAESGDAEDEVGDGSFALDVAALYLDEYIVANNELREIAPHVFASPRALLRGQLRGDLSIDGSTAYLSGMQVLLQTVQDGRTNGAPPGLGVQTEPSATEQRARRSCGGESTFAKHLQLQFVHFEDSATTVGDAQDHLDCAQKLWNPGHISFEAHDGGTLSHSSNGLPLQQLFDMRPNESEPWIPVFFVKSTSTGAVGAMDIDDAATVNPTTALAMVAISEAASDLTLAHELGHVMGGLSFGQTLLEAGQWNGDPDTILTENPVERNSPRNCRMAQCPTLDGTGNTSECLPARCWDFDEEIDC
jgi:hypothetical protein